MKFSVSNIAWSAEYDEEMYGFLSCNGFSGLEIAPTRIFPHAPYDNLTEAERFARKLKKNYGLAISSMQSIWFGIAESVFGSNADRQKLTDYTKKAVDFARVVNCPNIVFGCPKNRAVPSDMPPDNYLPVAYDFFNKIGNYASANGTCIAVEPNPTIYNTNFINTTSEAFEMCRKLGNPGIKVNVDVGTIIYNNENIGILKDNIDLINHIHISEPYLAPIENRALHCELRNVLQNLNYDKFLSVEMGNPNDIDLVKKAVIYIKELWL
ncbi:MAG: sugar phosphate isomerase/epimerase [Endomicrobia bacterium]|nr:sugar phosphate isomerase/epimerase [Endomicrobiia bacterium]